MSEIGIIGFGQFGQFMARHLVPFFEVSVFDHNALSAEANAVGANWSDFETAVSRKTVIFATPLSSFEKVLKLAVPFLAPNALCLDVCSVKIKPIELMTEILPDNVEIIGTHPLFGPQSGRKGIAGMRIAVCPVRTTRLEQVKKFLSNDLKLLVFEKTPEAHDQEMAHVQALTHFVSRALDELHIEASDLATVSYDEIMRAARLVSEDSWELFQTIQQDNPFAQVKRKAFINKLIELESRII